MGRDLDWLPRTGGRDAQRLIWAAALFRKSLQWVLIKAPPTTVLHFLTRRPDACLLPPPPFYFYPLAQLISAQLPITCCGVLPPVTNRCVDSPRHRRWFKPTPAVPQGLSGGEASSKQQCRTHSAGGATSWIFCIINYLWVATSCYLHWTDGDAVQDCSGGRRGSAGMAGEVKACVNVLNIVGKRHLQLPKWRREKRGGGCDSAGTETLSKLQRMQELQLYNV